MFALQTFPVKSLRSLSLRTALLLTDGVRRRDAIRYIKHIGLAPRKLSVMMLPRYSNHYLVQFELGCEIEPYSQVFSSLDEVLNFLDELGYWKPSGLDLFNVLFHRRHVPHLKRTIEKLEVSTVVLRNCQYQNIGDGVESAEVWLALKASKAYVFEYGEDLLESRICEQDLKTAERRAQRANPRLLNPHSVSVRLHQMVSKLPVVGSSRPRSSCQSNFFLPVRETNRRLESTFIGP